jgi:hypothetical protein
MNSRRLMTFLPCADLGLRQLRFITFPPSVTGKQVQRLVGESKSATASLRNGVAV